MIDFSDLRDFLCALRVNTKEQGVVYLGETLMGTQKHWLREIQAGLEQDVHEFVTLKCRQIGISTVSLGLDMYYAGRYECQGAIVVHDEPARSQFRQIFTTYHDGLEGQWQMPIVSHNRDQLVFANGSLFQYKVAGLKETSSKSLGRSSALVFGHMTEVAFWGDPQQISSLKSSMAEHNPLRFFNWETTANGFNHFEQMWQDAQDSVSVKPIFVTWWHNEFYRAKRGGAIYKKYWNGRVTDQEKDWIRQVKLDFDFDLDDEQLAWYRWVRAEKVTDEMSLFEEFPTVPEEAFVATGAKFFTGKSLSEAYRKVLAQKKPSAYRFQFGEEFTDTRMVEVNDKGGQAHLKVWEDPQPGAYYAIGADPAHGVNEESDRYCVQVLRCWANRTEQVAEVCCTDLSNYQFAWVIVYLGGCFQPCTYNIEVNGPGGSVLSEIDNLKKMAGKSYIPGGHSKDMMDVVRKMREFYFVREDSMTQRPMGKHTLTSERIKDAYMTMFKDGFERGTFVPHSRGLLDEMKSVVRDGTWIGADNTSHDDRPIAAALAQKAYNDQLKQELIVKGIKYVPPAEAGKVKVYPQTVLGRSLQNYLAKINDANKPKSDKARAYNIGNQNGR